MAGGIEKVDRMRSVLLSNILIACLAVYLKLIHGKLHGLLARLMRYADVDRELVSRIIATNEQMFLATVLLALLATVIAITLRKRSKGPLIVAALIVSIVSLVICLVVVF